MARSDFQKSHFQNIKLQPNSKAGDAAGDVALAVTALNDPNTTVFQVSNTGNVVGRLTTLAVTAASTADITLTAATHGGKTLLVSGDFAFNVILPANTTPAGTIIRCVHIGTDTCAPTYAAATADSLIAKNDAAADSVTFATGNRIGSIVLFIATGAAWVAINENGSCTMTVNT
jgi:hypothetical protein